MLDLDEIHSLSDFQRSTKAHLRRLKKSGKPQVLTVNGRAEVVVQDARAYQRILDRLDEVDTIAAIRRGLESIDRGEGVPLEEFDRRMRQRHDIPKRRT